MIHGKVTIASKASIAILPNLELELDRRGGGELSS